MKKTENKTEESELKKLNPKQELFCKLYATNREFFGNGTESYIEAYNVDMTKPNSYNNVKSSAARLLSNVNVFTRINAILEETGLNDSAVDKQLLFIIHQHADFGSKVAAIREYNKLKQRITDKFDHTTNGKDIQGNTVIFKDFSDDERSTEV